MAKAFAYKENIIVSGRGSDTKVTQTGSISTNADYEILLSKSANDTTETDTVNKASGLTYNPSTNQLKINGTAVLTQHQDISGKVNKSGDTMSGALNMSDAEIFVKDLDIETDTDPSSAVWGKGYYLTCTDDVSIGYFRAIKSADGKQGVQVETNRTISGTRYTNHLNLRIANDGTNIVEVSNPAVWRTALGLGSMATQASSSYVAKAGDTMSGTLNFSNTTVNITVPARSISWIQGNSGNAGIYAKKALNTDQWYPVVCMDTKSGGSWAIGNYNNEDLEFSYATKANRDSQTNTTSIVHMRNVAGTIALTSEVNAKVSKSGDTMTGGLTFALGDAILYKGTKATLGMIHFIDNTTDGNGNGIAIGGGGQTIIGGGESWNVMKGQAGTSGSEIMYIGNDGDVQIHTNLQNGWSSRKTFTFGYQGRLTIPEYCYASYYNASCGVETPSTSSYIIYANSDGFFRKSSLANIKSILGISGIYSNQDGNKTLTAGTVVAGAGLSLPAGNYVITFTGNFPSGGGTSKTSCGCVVSTTSGGTTAINSQALTNAKYINDNETRVSGATIANFGSETKIYCNLWLRGSGTLSNCWAQMRAIRIG